mgnify:CR=1 FL=1
MYYFNVFLIYSFFGYLFEGVVSLVSKGSFKSGIMYGPWTPIYGFGVIIILILSSFLFKVLHLPKFFEIIIVFLVITFILTFLEWLGGVGIEKLFHKVIWDYSNQRFHLGKYVSLTASLTWGVGSLFVIYVLHPLIKSRLRNIPFYLTIIFIFLFVLDFIYTFVKNVKV